ncbi:IS3-like element ISBlo10 family transposase, partial [Corynebacterium diphtheriae]
MTTRQSKGLDLRPDLVNCEFKALAPNRLWVADITYVRTRTRLCVHRVCIPDGSLGGRYQIPCALQTLPLQALNQ